MTHPIALYEIVGRSLPITADSNPVHLGSLMIGPDTLSIRVETKEYGSRIVRCPIWEHTIYELERLSSSLKEVASGDLDLTLKVDRHQSAIGDQITLSFAAECELGYNLKFPGSGRARFMCSYIEPRPIPSPIPAMQPALVWIALGLLGTYNEVVIGVQEAEDLSNWIDEQLTRFEVYKGL